MMGEQKNLKVLEYSNNNARIYYVGEDNSTGNVLCFIKNGTQWEYSKRELCVWSKSGSASGAIWAVLAAYYLWRFLSINSILKKAEYYDAEIGYIYLRARYYDVKDGRFISGNQLWSMYNMIYWSITFSKGL